ncbi:MAG: right-handed parallel beta-helix repeat-containing protein [Chloroflexi bacterium]|nr:right-handed parallel beta-helix repeat-containing protein [Chloroflexota bacterium]
MKPVLFVFTILLTSILISCAPLSMPVASAPTFTLTLPPSETSTAEPTATSTAVPTKTPIINRTTQGTLERNETWKGEILITGDIVIPRGITLTIKPGTIIRFTGQKDNSPIYDPNAYIDTADYQSFPNDPPRIQSNMIGIYIDGSMIANGTPENPIVFTSNREFPELNDWHTIEILSNGNISLSYAIVEYNYHGVDIADARKPNSPNIEIHNNLFQHIAGCCVCTGGGASIFEEITIEKNVFTDCNHEGIDTYKDQNLVIRNNLFEDNYVGVVVNDGSTIKIESNIFRENRWAAIGIWNGKNGSSPEIHLNNFINNQVHIRINNSNSTVDASNNYWGSENPRVFTGKGLVLFRPFSNTPFDIPVPMIP